MKAAPGAQLPVKDVFGRDGFIARLWRALETNSVRMEAERRVGKTSILHKMAAEPLPGWDPVSLDLEQVHSAAEFAEMVCENVHQRLVGWKKQGKRLLHFLGLLGGAEVGPIKFPPKKDRSENYWKTLLTTTIEDLVEQQAASDKRVVFLFDEMPWMLAAIAKREGEQTAMEVLDTLRTLRQSATTGQGFRMVLCGSIGLHHILGSLRQQGYKNEPVNDMTLVEVPPLEPSVAAGLAAGLLEGDGVAADEAAPSLIADRTGGYPYYVQWVVYELRLDGQPANADNIDRVMKKLLTAPHDPCDIRHFRSRIDGYYPKAEKFVLAVLDHAARASAPLSQAELINVAKSAGDTDDEQIRELLRLMALDHYLGRDTDGRYTFRNTLLRQWWILDRGLN